MTPISAGLHVEEHGRRRAIPAADFLRRLAAIDVGRRALVSVLVDTAWRDEQQRERTAVFARRMAARLIAEAPDATAADDARAAGGIIEQAAEGMIDSPIHLARGLAVYRCTPANIALLVWMPIAPAPEMALARRPLIWQLARIGGLLADTLVALADAGKAILYELSAGGAETIARIDGDSPPKHARGGWSQSRNQRHIAVHRDVEVAEAAQILTARFDAIRSAAGAPPLVFLGGRAELLPALRAKLPARVIEQSRPIDLDPSAPRASVEEAALRALEQRQEEGLAASLDAIRSQAGEAHHSLFGAQGVMDALLERRVSQIVFARSYSGRGGVCVACGMASARDGAGRCASCGGALEPVDLREELAREAIANGATIGMIAADAHLVREGGVGALLRY